MGKSITPVPFVDGNFFITVTECSNDCAKFINRTITLNEFIDFYGEPVNFFEVVGNNGVEYRFESHHGQWVQGD